MAYETILRTAEAEEAPVDGAPGFYQRLLHVDEETGAMAVVTRMEAGAQVPAHYHSKADEIVYVLSGEYIENGESYGPGTFFFGKANTPHGPQGSTQGCVTLTHFSAELDFIPVE